MAQLLDILYKEIDNFAASIPDREAGDVLLEETRRVLNGLYDDSKEKDDWLDLVRPQPIIGISANQKGDISCLADAYFRSVLLAGGAAVIVPAFADPVALKTIVEQLDGLILSGGGDIDAEFLGEAPIPELGETDFLRDTYDFMLLKLAFDRQLPIFGICRGHQVINVAFGGTLYQDIDAQYYKDNVKKKPVVHDQEEARDVATHFAYRWPMPSRLEKAFGLSDPPTFFVNSFHHQAVKDLAPEFVETAVAKDSVIEAMEHPEYPIASVQWHPESMALTGDEMMLNLFRYHVAQAVVFAKAKRLHHRIVTLDSHTDTPMLFESFDLGRKEGGKVNLPLMEEGRLDAVYMVAYQPQGARDDVSLQLAYASVLERLSKITEQVEKYQAFMGIARTSDDVYRLKREGKKSILLGVENGYAIGKDLEKLERLKALGVSYITLCHNGDNDICDSAAGNAEWGGLSPFGKELVAEMNRLGLLIDVSHAADSTFYDVLKYSTKPVVASHSAARALCRHRRNLDDDQIRALAAQGGVMQVCLYKEFINEESDRASLSDVIKHISHVIEVGGIDAVGIGSDFDGDGEVIGCRAANELIQITQRLIAEGFDDACIEKIWGGNFLRALCANEK